MTRVVLDLMTSRIKPRNKRNKRHRRVNNLPQSTTALRRNGEIHLGELRIKFNFPRVLSAITKLIEHLQGKTNIIKVLTVNQEFSQESVTPTCIQVLVLHCDGNKNLLVYLRDQCTANS